MTGEEYSRQGDRDCKGPETESVNACETEGKRVGAAEMQVTGLGLGCGAGV